MCNNNRNVTLHNSKPFPTSIHIKRHDFFHTFRFRPYSGMGAHGFKIMYEAPDCPDGTLESSAFCSGQCRNSYYDRTGTLTFPHNLGESMKRINCAYDIIQEQGSYIKIKEVNISLPCGIAFLEIRDGPHEDSPLMGRFCDENYFLPAKFASTQNHVFIRQVKRTYS